jgi:hypothetical protein
MKNKKEGRYSIVHLAHLRILTFFAQGRVGSGGTERKEAAGRDFLCIPGLPDSITGSFSIDSLSFLVWLYQYNTLYVNIPYKEVFCQHFFLNFFTCFVAKFLLLFPTKWD